MMKKLFHIILSALILVPALCAGQDGVALNGKPFFRNFLAEEYNGHNSSFDIECDGTGKVYVANFEGLLVWNGLKWRMIHTPAISRITALYIDGNGRLWFGGYNVFGYLDEEDVPHYLISDDDEESSYGEISSIFSENGRIAFRAEELTYVVNGDTVESDSSVTGGQSGRFTWNGIYINDSIDIEDLGIKAWATESYGLAVTYGDEYEVIFSLTTEDGLCSNGITALKYDGKGSLWGVTDNGIFQVYVSSVFSRFGGSDGLSGRVTSILESDGTLFVGTLQGLFRQEKDGHFRRIEEISLACWNLAEDAQGNVLAATVNGVFQCTPQVRQLTKRHTLCLCAQPDGSILTGEIDGIFHHREGREDTRLLSAPSISRINCEADGGIRAVNYYQYTYYRAPGSDEFVIVNDNKLSLLLDYTDEQGLRWTPNKDGRGLTYEGISPNEQEWCSLLNEYSIDAMFRSGNSVWIGGDFGMMRMQIDLMKTLKTFIPELHLRSFTVDGKNVSYAVSMDKYDPMGTPKFCYRLREGMEWSRWADYSEMSFSNLSAGKYQLSVRCKDSYGHVSEIKPVEFRIKAPFYLRWYALLLYVTIISLNSYAFTRYKLYRAAKEKQRLEALVEERTSELKEAQNMLLNQEREATVGKLTRGLIDRILNPMNYINNFTLLTKGLVKDMVQDIDDDKENMTPDIYDDALDVIDMMKQNLEKIEQHGMATTRILKAMEALLKEHSGNLETTDMEQLCGKDLEVIRKYFRNDIEKDGTVINFDVKVPGITANVNPQNMSKAIASIISNSFYAISKKCQKSDIADFSPEIRLTLDRGADGNGCVIEIYDNGIGIEETIMDKIFDPFFTTKPTNEAPGVGLYLSRQIVQYSNGTISAESKKDEYTTITITLP